MQKSYTREEIDQVMQTKQSIKEFGTNLVNHLQNMLDYLKQVKGNRLIRQNYAQVIQSDIHTQFSQTLRRTKGTTLVQGKIHALFANQYDKVAKSFDQTL